MKMNKEIFRNPWTYVIAIALVVVVFYLGGGITGNVVSSGGEYDTFATCLTDAGAVMHGTEWCSHCKAQKAMFGSSFSNINYIDCDRDRDACLIAGVTGYPTWKIDNQNYPGQQQLSRLAELTGCELVKDSE